jgi:hypothetical protein
VAQQLLLEGADIDELLLRVRREHGPDVRIVRAERKLVGGWGGFFAKRRFEVAIDVEPAAAQPAQDVIPQPPAPAPVVADEVLSHLPALQPQRSLASSPRAAYAAAFTTSLPSLPSRPSSRQAPASAVSGAVSSLDTPSGLDDLLAVADAADAADAAVRSSGRQLSTESDAFDDLVRDLVARAAPEVRPAPLGDFRAVPVRVLDAATPSPDEPKPEPAPEPEPEVEPEVEPEAEPEPEVVPSTPRKAVEGRPAQARLVTPAVARLGLPVERVTMDSDRLSLLEVLDEIAVRAPRRLVGVQVLVGDGDAVRRLAAAWARTTGADDACVLDVDALAADDEDPRGRVHQLHDLAREHGGVLVVLPAGDAPTAAAAAAAALTDLGPCTVTATVDARWTANTTSDWLAALADAGRPADRLAAYEIHETPDPLGLLEHELPVTWLDARPATIGAWASPCLDRWQ